MRRLNVENVIMTIHQSTLQKGTWSESQKTKFVYGKKWVPLEQLNHINIRFHGYFLL